MTDATIPMSPADVPDDLVAAGAATRSYLTHPDVLIRSILAAVLPLHEQQVRAAVVEELKAHAFECCDLAEKYMDERSGPLTHEAAYFAVAARYISSDDEEDDTTREVSA